MCRLWGGSYSSMNAASLEAAFRLAHASTTEERQECGRAAKDHYEKHMSREAGVRAVAAVLVSASGLSTGAHIPTA